MSGGLTRRREVNRKSGVNAASLAVAWSMLAGVSGVWVAADARGATLMTILFLDCLMTSAKFRVCHKHKHVLQAPLSASACS